MRQVSRGGRKTTGLRRSLISAGLLGAICVAVIEKDALAQDVNGQELYVEHCASCHGVNLEGQPNWRTRLSSGRMPAPPHDETGHTWHHADDQLFQITKQGIEALAPKGYESDMLGFGDVLSDDEIWAVLTFIKSTWPDKIRETQAKISGKGQ